MVLQQHQWLAGGGQASSDCPHHPPTHAPPSNPHTHHHHHHPTHTRTTTTTIPRTHTNTTPPPPAARGWQQARSSPGGSCPRARTRPALPQRVRGGAGRACGAHCERLHELLRASDTSRPQGRSRCTPRGAGQAGARTRCGARGGVCRVPTPPHTRTHTRPAVVRRAAAQVARGGARTRPAMPHRGGGQGGRVGHRRSIRYYEGCCAVRHNVRPLQGESEPAVLVVADGAVGCAPTPPRSRGWDGRGGGGREAPDPLPLPPDQHRHPTHPHKTPPQPAARGWQQACSSPGGSCRRARPRCPSAWGGGRGGRGEGLLNGLLRSLHHQAAGKVGEGEGGGGCGATSGHGWGQSLSG